MKIYKKIIIGIVIGIVLLLFLSSIRTVDRNDRDDAVDMVPALTGNIDLVDRPVRIEDFVVEDFVVEDFVVEDFVVEDFTVEDSVVENFAVEEKLTEAEIDLIVDGIVKYNAVMQTLFDQCLATDSTEDFIVLMYLFNELDSRVEVVHMYNDVIERLLDAGYGSHVRLGPIIEESLTLGNGVIICYKLMLDALE